MNEIPIKCLLRNAQMQFAKTKPDLRTNVLIFYLSNKIQNERLRDAQIKITNDLRKSKSKLRSANSANRFHTLVIDLFLFSNKVVGA